MQEMNLPPQAQATIRFKIQVPMDQQEVVIALLSDTEAYAFEEKRDGLHAYFPESGFDETEVKSLLAGIFPDAATETERIEAQDWNASWESNFESVLVDDFVEVHPPFRQPSAGVQHHIQLMPRMAFGTGHHSTTWLMLQACSRLNFQDRTVLDMGCGTAVLGIMASKLGAQKVVAVDIDPWSEENAKENAKLNQINNLDVRVGDASAIPDECYDIILANINKNVLLTDRDVYLGHLNKGGYFLLSGILDRDEAQVDSHYRQAGFIPWMRQSRNEWIMIGYTL
jgi:ribosomal protein L11 methyltransferase